MAPTPSSKSNQTHSTQIKTPHSKNKLHFTPAKNPNPSPNPNTIIKETLPAEHPVEVIGRIRDYSDRKDKPVSALHINQDRKSLRVRTETGYSDFVLDGVSLSEEEDLEGFYIKFVQSRINGVKLGAKCTIMMYGPTGSGKSHTMFGCPKQPGIVYKSLQDILGERGEESESDDHPVAVGTFVQVTVLEIYNEEIYDLLSSNNGGGLSFGWSKGNSSKVKLEVMGKKAKNATFISGNEAGKILKEIQKVEKRRIVKSTLCNDRSSRSHCMIILDVPTVGGRLMLVDMAGSENIEQAGQIGFEAKMQTAKINQGNIALKRVVESIANGDSHVPFRDSKLTMLLQDSFEDDKSKILMILCASPDPKELHKTISTLEYGAKAKCIVRGPQTPVKDKAGGEDSSSAVILGSRIAAMDQFIMKLQMENKLREKERNEAHKKLLKMEEEVASLRAKLELMEGRGSETNEEEINMKVKERTQSMKLELEKKLLECKKAANELVELEKRRMEEKILQQQQEIEMLRHRLEEIESEVGRPKAENTDGHRASVNDGSGFAKKLMEIYADEDPGMIKSMDLDMGDQEPFCEVKYVGGSFTKMNNGGNIPDFSYLNEDKDCDFLAPKFSDRVCLSTVFEEDEVEEKEESEGRAEDEEVEKEIIEEKKVCSSSPMRRYNLGPFSSSPMNFGDVVEEKHMRVGSLCDSENGKETASSRLKRIQNIFTLCGNHRELSQQIRTPVPTKKRSDTDDHLGTPLITPGEESAAKDIIEPQKGALMPESTLENQGHPDTPVKNISEITSPALSTDPLSLLKVANGQKKATSEMDEVGLKSAKENCNPANECKGDMIEVYVKWEATKENPGKIISTFKVLKDSSLADLRKLVESHLGLDKRAFAFLALGDPTGAPVAKEKEATVLASKLPICSNQIGGHLACLRPTKGLQPPNHVPFASLENKFNVNFDTHLMLPGDGFSPKLARNFSPTPFVM
ncbi:Kinesin motor domain [Dillenia turbinata]|uniref:Kinesin-like protein KIN-10A n=1 Tax=Dillenia turbinata TaxID=194707 RepID=A0AAN8VDQ1_9MAGN